MKRSTNISPLINYSAAIIDFGLTPKCNDVEPAKFYSFIDGDAVCWVLCVGSHAAIVGSDRRRRHSVHLRSFFSEWKMGCQIWRQYHTHASHSIPFVFRTRFVWIFAKPKFAGVRVCESLNRRLRVCTWRPNSAVCMKMSGERMSVERMSTKSLVWKMILFIEYHWCRRHVCNVDVIYESIHERIPPLRMRLRWVPSRMGMVACFCSFRSHRRDTSFWWNFHSWLFFCNK